MICPKCGFEQPDNPECVRCGVIISRYKGPALNTPPQPVSLPLSGNETVRMAFEPPVPAPAAAAAAIAGAGAGGTVYGGPPPPPPPGGSAYGGTVYNGAVAAPAPAFGMARATSLGVGDLLNQTFSIYFANLVPFVVLTGICLSPLYILEGVVTSSTLSATQGEVSPLLIFSVLLFVLGLVLFPNLATGAITYGVFQQMRRQETSIGDCLSRGMSALPRVLGLALVQGFLVGLGLVACIIPGILLALRWSVSVPAAVTERTEISESMSRSTFLTEGFRGDVFGFLFVLNILNFGASLLVKLATSSNPTLFLVVSGVKDLFVVGLSATGTAVLYYRLRSAKESIDVDQIASVFA